jgi:hypothetical protein
MLAGLSIMYSLRPPPSFVPSIDYEWERHKSTQETCLLCEMYATEPPGGWTDAQYDVVIEELASKSPKRAAATPPALRAPSRQRPLGRPQPAGPKIASGRVPLASLNL